MTIIHLSSLIAGSSVRANHFRFIHELRHIFLERAFISIYLEFTTGQGQSKSREIFLVIKLQADFLLPIEDFTAINYEKAKRRYLYSLYQVSPIADLSIVSRIGEDSH